MPIAINGNGTITGISVGGLPNGSVDRDTLATTAKGSILQVQVGTNDAQTDSVTTSGTNAYTIISQTITPVATSSKILVMAELYGDIDGNYNGMGLLLLRDSTEIGLAAANSSVGRFNAVWQTGNNADRVNLATIFYLDSPSSTSELTYYVKVQDGNGDGGTYTVNRTASWGQNSAHCATASHIILMEVAG